MGNKFYADNSRGQKFYESTLNENGKYTGEYRVYSPDFRGVNFLRVDKFSDGYIIVSSHRTEDAADRKNEREDFYPIMRVVHDALHNAAAALGRVKSDRKSASSRENGKRGGRPKKSA